MIEREIFLNMIKRVAKNSIDEDELDAFFKVNEDGTISIFNSSNYETVFRFDEQGNLDFYE